jgi:hypothetical protein
MFTGKTCRLGVCDSDDEPIQLVAHRDLTRKPASRATACRQPQGRLFIFVWWADGFYPRLVDISVAGTASTTSATNSEDTGNTVSDGAFHYGQATGNVALRAFAVGANINYLRHFNLSPVDNRRVLTFWWGVRLPPNTQPVGPGSELLDRDPRAAANLRTRRNPSTYSDNSVPHRPPG